MARLLQSQRDQLPSSDFAIPETRQYPIHDHAHQVAAIMDSAGKPEHHRVVLAVMRKRAEQRSAGGQ